MLFYGKWVSQWPGGLPAKHPCQSLHENTTGWPAAPGAEFQTQDYYSYTLQKACISGLQIAMFVSFHGNIHSGVATLNPTRKGYL